MTIFVVLGAFFSVVPFNLKVYAAEEMNGDVAQEEKLQEILGVLNETLEENRGLRENIDTVKSALERMTIENNVLRTRVRNLEKTIDAKDALSEKDQEAAESQQKAYEELENEKEKLLEVVMKREDELKKESEENEKITALLSRAILEDERDEYQNLIQTAQKQANDAVIRLAGTKRENEQIKIELIHMHYRLGNVMFESKNYDGAIKQYKKTLEWDSSHSWAHHNLAIIYDFYLDDHPLAIYHYERYLVLKPIDEEAQAIRERVLELELLKKVVPSQPLKLDFSKYHRAKR